jgi:hypothetical protein
LISTLPPMRSAISLKHGQLGTFIFQTKQGTCGIMRVVGSDGSLSQLKLHYKLVPLGTQAQAVGQ